jgi:transcriptional regulator with PAS, ATPase and Fis domain
MEENQPWATCLFADILLTYVEEALGRRDIDLISLFRSIEGFEIPPDPRSFLKGANNWVPLAVLRELLTQCERLSGRKDVAYRAARAYFDRQKGHFPSLFEIVVRVLNDVRSVFICANLWGAVQTNYLKLQSFADEQEKPALYMLAQFDEKAKPTIGALELLRGICEGFPRLYPFIEDVRCIEEISQLKIADVAVEFPDFHMEAKGEEIVLFPRGSTEPVVRARKVFLKSETVSLSAEFLRNIPSAVVAPGDGEIQVLMRAEETEKEKQASGSQAYRIIQAGVLTHQKLAYPMDEGRIYNAPYSRFRFLWEENPKTEDQASVEEVRKEISQLLFSHLRQTRDAHMLTVEQHIEKSRLTLENLYLRKEIEREHGVEGIIGKSPKMKELFDLLRSVAETDMTVLIQGETGTGKELIARAIHYNSPRKPKRFVAINCGALSETLLESELFGHEKGAFTGATIQRKGIFEAADGGTLFLDEIGETTPSTQVKLLRVLQDGEFQRVGGTEPIKVDVRIIAATNQNLEGLVQKNRFRQDLYYRLNVFPLKIPPLRERSGDIPLLVSHFIDKAKKSLHKAVSGVSSQAMALLMAYPWPGNVRELENLIQRMMVVAKAELLDTKDLPQEILGKREMGAQPKDLKEIARESAELIEKHAILDALSKTKENVTQAAKILGISRATLQNKMKLYGLRSTKEEKHDR